MASGLLIVATTTADRDQAERIATALVGRRLAACVQISGPVTSVYRWRGAVERSEEYVCTAKTIAERFPEIAELINELHAYDTPELIATPIADAAADYAAWLRAEVAEP